MLPKWAALLFMALGAAALLAGCGGGEAIDDRSMIFAMTFDAAPHRQILVTAEEINPAASLVSGQQTSQSGGGPPAFIFQATAPSISQALSQLQLEASKRIDLSEAGILIFSQKLSQRGLVPILSFLSRQGRAPLTAWCLVSQGSAAALLTTAPNNTPYGSTFGSLILSQQVLQTHSPHFVTYRLWKVFRDALTPESDATLPLIDHTGPKLAYVGAALLHRGKMAASLTSNETAVLQMLRRNAKGGILPVSQPGGGRAVLRFTEVHSQVKLLPGPRVMIHLSLLGNVAETSGTAQSETLGDDKVLQQEAAKSLVQQILALYHLLGKAPSDPLTIGSQLRVADPKLWEKWRTAWPQELSRIPATVKVQVQITSASL